MIIENQLEANKKLRDQSLAEHALTLQSEQEFELGIKRLIEVKDQFHTQNMVVK